LESHYRYQKQIARSNEVPMNLPIKTIVASEELIKAEMGILKGLNSESSGIHEILNDAKTSLKH
jgi:hypothetical protein